MALSNRIKRLEEIVGPPEGPLEILYDSEGQPLLCGLGQPYQVPVTRPDLPIVVFTCPTFKPTYSVPFPCRCAPTPHGLKRDEPT